MKTFSEKTLKTVEGLRLIDDALFRLVGARKEVCQEILRTLLDDEKLIVLQATPQERITSLHREIVLDVLCELGGNKLVNIEMQKGEQNDSDIKRCRLHLSSITANKTPKGTDFRNIPDVTIVYITEYDALGNGKTVTCTEMCQRLDEGFKPLGDGGKVYYANTVCKDDTDKTQLLDLLTRKDSFDSKKFPNISKAVKYYKEDKEGVSEVCTIVEEYAKEYAEEYAKEIAKSLLAEGMSVEKISQITKLSENEIEKLRS